MPKVQFLVNLGSRDASDFNLKFTDCVKGGVVDVDADTLAALKKRCGEFCVAEAPKAEAIAYDK